MSGVTRGTGLKVHVFDRLTYARSLFGNSVIVLNILAGGAPAEGRYSTPYLYVDFYADASRLSPAEETIVYLLWVGKERKVSWYRIFGWGVDPPPRVIGGFGPAPDNSQGRQWIHYPPRIGRVLAAESGQLSAKTAWRRPSFSSAELCDL